MKQRADNAGWAVRKGCPFFVSRFWQSIQVPCIILPVRQEKVSGDTTRDFQWLGGVVVPERV